MLTRNLLVITWTLQIVVAVILFQTLFFKFTGAEESVYIFSTLGVEPWGRIGAALAELVAVILLLYPPTAVYGALLSTGVITGALLSHTRLGLVVKDDGGLLFGLAVVVFLASVSILVIRRGEVPLVAGRLIRALSPS
jgi:hypothetical protein